MVHYLDVANWFLDLGTPTSAPSIGDHFNKEGIWQTPDTVQTLLQYDTPKTQVYFEGTFSNAPNGTLFHIENWLECIRTREEPNAPVVAGVRAATTAHLPNQALRTGKVVKA
jgi:hypothetical protein